uniref:Uncharacterized protein n=1 Tax=Chromera velia CCMP2878 TaxID=1169474 RepID=A0A0G4GE61_9ALVE|eukprot:Cvel_4576.t1-p1 / transcript=Cvel_4576.t1 / gene=Cvel_4576 / organism=Chromera_velia_CCMP2878 / gene_product=Polycystin-2, putative / transcript_product=Polycystin-2, putative / location=Cvel_scaffold201:49063-54588(-) / protein_length=1219 / sequence_SO=supercontig / SO=protein_coding / is_pseudo=false
MASTTFKLPGEVESEGPGRGDTGIRDSGAYRELTVKPGKLNDDEDPTHPKGLPSKSAFHSVNLRKDEPAVPIGGYIFYLKKARREKYCIYLTLYLIFLCSFLAIVYLARPIEQSFEVQRAILDSSSNAEFPKETWPQSFNDIITEDDWWYWLLSVQTPFLLSVVPQNQFDRLTLPYTYLMMPVRLRQVRTKTNTCITPENNQVLSRPCWAEFSRSDANTTEFGTQYGNQWTSGLSNIRARDGYGPNYGDAAFVVDVNFIGSDMDTVPVANSSDGTGNYSDVQWNRQGFTDTFTVPWQIAAMFNDTWIDRSTAAATIEAGFYNPNEDLAVYIEWTVSMSVGGRFQPNVNVYVARLFPYSKFRDLLRLGLEGLFACFLIAFICIEIVEARQLGKYYWRNFWNYVEILSLLGFMAMLGIWGWYQVQDRDRFSRVRDDFVDLYDVAWWFNLASQVAAFNAIFAFLKVFKYLQMFPALNAIWDVLVFSMTDTFPFIIVFTLIIMGFTFAVHWIYGFFLTEFHSWVSSFSTLLQTLAGGLPYDLMKFFSPIATPVFYGTFILVVIFVLINMFVAILTDAHAEVQGRIRAESAIIEATLGKTTTQPYLVGVWKWLKSRLSRYFRKKPKKGKGGGAVVSAKGGVGGGDKQGKTKPKMKKFEEELKIESATHVDDERSSDRPSAAAAAAAGGDRPAFSTAPTVRFKDEGEERQIPSRKATEMEDRQSALSTGSKSTFLRGSTEGDLEAGTPITVYDASRRNERLNALARLMDQGKGEIIIKEAMNEGRSFITVEEIHETFKGDADSASEFCKRFHRLREILSAYEEAEEGVQQSSLASVRNRISSLSDKVRILSTALDDVLNLPAFSQTFPTVSREASPAGISPSPTSPHNITVPIEETVGSRRASTVRERLNASLKNQIMQEAFRAANASNRAARQGTEVHLGSFSRLTSANNLQEEEIGVDLTGGLPGSPSFAQDLANQPSTVGASRQATWNPHLAPGEQERSSNLSFLMNSPDPSAVVIRPPPEDRTPPGPNFTIREDPQETQPPPTGGRGTGLVFRRRFGGSYEAGNCLSPLRDPPRPPVDHDRTVSRESLSLLSSRRTSEREEGPTRRVLPTNSDRKAQGEATASRSSHYSEDRVGLMGSQRTLGMRGTSPSPSGLLLQPPSASVRVPRSANGGRGRGRDSDEVVEPSTRMGRTRAHSFLPGPAPLSPSHRPDESDDSAGGFP